MMCTEKQLSVRLCSIRYVERKVSIFIRDLKLSLIYLLINSHND